MLDQHVQQRENVSVRERPEVQNSTPNMVSCFQEMLNINTCNSVISEFIIVVDLLLFHDRIPENHHLLIINYMSTHVSEQFCDCNTISVFDD